MNGLPKWVYDVVMALQKWEEEHPSLRDADAFPARAVCLGEVVDLVPKEVRQAADMIREYVQC